MADVNVTHLRKYHLKGFDNDSTMLNKPIDLYGFVVTSVQYGGPFEEGLIEMELLPADENSQITPSEHREELRRQLDTSREVNKELNATVEELRYELHDTKRLLEREREEYRASRKGYVDQLHERAVKLNDLRTELHKAERDPGEVKRLSEKLENLEAAYEKLDQLRQRAVSDLASVDKQKSELKKEFADSVDRHKQTKSDRDGLAEELARVKQERDALAKEARLVGPRRQQADHRFADERRKLEQENEHQRKTLAAYRDELRTAKRNTALYATALWQARKAHETAETSIKERVYAALFEDRQVKPDDDSDQ